MKKLWIEEHLGVKLNWYQRIWFWPQDREIRRKHQRLLEKIEELNRRDQFLQKVEDEMHPAGMLMAPVWPPSLISILMLY